MEGSQLINHYSAAELLRIHLGGEAQVIPSVQENRVRNLSAEDALLQVIAGCLSVNIIEVIESGKTIISTYSRLENGVDSPFVFQSARSELKQ